MILYDGRGPLTIFQDKMVTRAKCDEAGHYAVPNVFSPKDLVFRHDFLYKSVHTHKLQKRTNVTVE